MLPLRQSFKFLRLHSKYSIKSKTSCSPTTRKTNTATTYTMADTRPVFFFDIDNCVSIDSYRFYVVFLTGFCSYILRVSRTVKYLDTSY
jgi:hypothetical protein